MSAAVLTDIGQGPQQATAPADGAPAPGLVLFATEAGFRLRVDLIGGSVQIDLGGYGMEWLAGALRIAESARRAYSIVDEEFMERVWHEGAIQLRQKLLHQGEGRADGSDCQIVVRLVEGCPQVDDQGRPQREPLFAPLTGKEDGAVDAFLSFHGLERGERIDGQRFLEPGEQPPDRVAPEASSLPVIYVLGPRGGGAELSVGPRQRDHAGLDASEGGAAGIVAPDLDLEHVAAARVEDLHSVSEPGVASSANGIGTGFVG